jgi:hypothetical protein
MACSAVATVVRRVPVSLVTMKTTDMAATHVKILQTQLLKTLQTAHVIRLFLRKGTGL